MYVDDTNFDKIFVYQRSALMFAGNGGVIQQWKDWFATNPTNSTGAPDAQGICVCIVDMALSEVQFELGQDIVVNDARFAGSGSLHAHSCWSANKDARLAVESAKAMDIFSGGTVKFLDFSTGATNLLNSASILDVQQLILQKGMVMYKTSKSQIPIPVATAAANDQDVRSVVQEVAAGRILASAPCDAMHNTWSTKQIQEFHTALDKLLSR